MSAAVTEDKISVIVCDDSGMPSKANAPTVSSDDMAKWESQFDELDHTFGLNL